MSTWGRRVVWEVSASGAVIAITNRSVVDLTSSLEYPDSE